MLTRLLFTGDVLNLVHIRCWKCRLCAAVIQLEKITKAKGTLLILHLKKIEAKRILFIPQIQKIEAEQTLFIPQIGKIEAKRSLFASL